MADEQNIQGILLNQDQTQLIEDIRVLAKRFVELFNAGKIALNKSGVIDGNIFLATAESSASIPEGHVGSISRYAVVTAEGRFGTTTTKSLDNFQEAMLVSEVRLVEEFLTRMILETETSQ